MSTRLLPKQEIAAQKAGERKLEVDEGRKLAKKVDDLRELYGQEQAKFEQFKAGATREAKELTTTLRGQIQALQSDVADLEQRRQTALAPLDAEKAQLTAERATLEAEKEHLYQEKERSVQVFDSLNHDKEMTRVTYDRILEMRKDLDKLIADASADRKDTGGILNDAKEKRAIMEAEIESRERTLSHSETALYMRNVDLDNRERNLRVKEEELVKRERAVEDRYATLLRTEQRIHGKRPSR